MHLGFVYWFLMLVAILFNGYVMWPAPGAPRTAWSPFGGSLIWFILLCIIGYKLFGNPING